MTNAQYANKDKLFRTACEIAEVKPTRRQASKYRNQKGSAFKWRKAAIALLQTRGEDI